MTAALAVLLALTMGQAGAFAHVNESEVTDQTEPTKSASEMVQDSSEVDAGMEAEGTPSDSDGTDGSGDVTPSSGSETEATSDTNETTSEATTEKSQVTTTTSNPKIPTVKVTRKGSGLRISWTKIQGANYYEVYRSYKSGSKGKLLKKVKSKTAFTDKSVKSGKKAYYKVRAHKASGGFYGYSAAVSNVIYRVYIEAGHGIDRRGKWDPGCTWSKYQEAKLMIPICRSAAKHLRTKGVFVYTDAFSGNNRNLLWIVKHIRNYNVSVMVNVHCDYKKAPRGTLPLYRYSEQKKLAKCLNEGVHKTVKIKDRGLMKRKRLLVLNKTKKYCTTCLFETGNIKKDNKILREQYDAYGEGLAMGVCSYLGVKW